MNILLRYLARTCFPPFLWHERQKPLCIIYNDNLDTTQCESWLLCCQRPGQHDWPGPNL